MNNAQKTALMAELTEILEKHGIDQFVLVHSNPKPGQPDHIQASILATAGIGGCLTRIFSFAVDELSNKAGGKIIAVHEGMRPQKK